VRSKADEMASFRQFSLAHGPETKK